MTATSSKRGGDPVRSALPGRGVFVMGMARSGTSAVTRLMTLLGLAHCVDEDLIPPAHYNRLGFFESATIQGFNSILLHRWSPEGWRNPYLPPGWQREMGLRALHGPARRMFRSVYPTEPWVCKDSSLNFLLPFWIEVLDCRPEVVLIYRHPVAVARSLNRGAGFELARGLRIWEQHNRAAMSSVSGVPVALVSYDELVHDPASVADLLAGWLRCRGYAVPSGAEQDAVRSIDQGERHWHADSEDDVLLSASQRDLLALLERRRGVHARWAVPELGPPSEAAGRPPVGGPVRAIARRARWWWWVAEMTMPERLAAVARSLPAPDRARARGGGLS